MSCSEKNGGNLGRACARKGENGARLEYSHISTVLPNRIALDDVKFGPAQATHLSNNKIPRKAPSEAGNSDPTQALLVAIGGDPEHRFVLENERLAS